LSTDVFIQLPGVNFALRHIIGNQRLTDVPIPRHLAYLHGNLQDRLVLQYNLLNLALLNTMAVQLDLLILPPKECYFTIWLNARAIAAAIPYPLSKRQ
jgi:hypothetical protein